MMVRDLLPRLAELPPETELLVEMGGPEPNSVVVAGLDQPVAEDGVVSLRLDRADLLDALKDLRVHAERTLAAREESQR